MLNIKREISRTIPDTLPIKLSMKGEALLTAYGCVLLERDTGKSYIYTAANLKTGKSEVISRRKTPLTTSGVEAMVEQIRSSNVAGAGVLEVDSVFGEQMDLRKCKRVLNAIFNNILPQHGYRLRHAQVSLAEHILETINRRGVSLAEAEVGTGKTLAYLVPAILAKRGRLNGYWNMSFYTGSPYVEMANMPIVIATSSIALQKAIITDYIPALSDILMRHGIIKTTLTAVMRKGREHYICKRKLKAQVLFEQNPKTKKLLEGLLKPNAEIDLAEIEGLTPYVKRKISVPDRCDKHCPHREGCRYIRFREQAGSSTIDIQVCNHNYLLADTLRRADEQRPLIPNYQSVIIDEAHKFLQAARSMYGMELSSRTLPEIKDSVFELNLKHGAAMKLARKTARKLATESNRLFHRLLASAICEKSEEESNRLTAEIDIYAAGHIRNVCELSESLMDLLDSEIAVGNSEGRRAHIIWELKQIHKQAAALSEHGSLICWLETPNQSTSPGTERATLLCAIPKDLNERLYDDLWSRGIPAILTSGTLSAAGDFSHIKRSLGIERVSQSRLTETSKPSPFDYYENALLYISEMMPFPDQRNRSYIVTIAEEVEKLVVASHGHAAVLFTSYKAMDMVWEYLTERNIPFPMFRLDKGGIREIDRFRQNKKGVLFAAGALWEGIDIPGDALSMLIIVKLPFAVPDPIGEYEQTLYDNMDEYKERVIVPEMLIKLKQGFGRLIRTEDDTGAVAILDSRVNSSGTYRARVLKALPDCYVTDDISTVDGFMRVKKSPDYFE